MTDGGSDHIEFLGSFEALDDTRQQAKVLYPLPEILLLCLCAVLGGADSWVEVALYGQRKLGFLRRFFPFAHGVPSHDQLGNVFARLDAQQFQSCFIAWVERFTTAVRGVVAVDGKTLRRSFDRAAKQGPIHMISAWSSQQRLVLGQCKVANKSNEITAIPELLQLLELHGAVVTIDAMGCQRTIAAQIIDQKGKHSVYRWGVRIEWRAESAAEVAPERVEPDVFPGQRVGTMHVEFAAALGLTDVGPVGGAVAGTGEAVGLHEGLQEQRSVAVASLPVVGQPAAAAGQHRGSEIAHLHPGQDQEAGVVHDQLQAGFALGNAPADEAVAGGRLPGAGAKADDRQHAPPAGDQVAHLCSRQRRIAEVVVAVHVLAPQLRFALIGERS